MHGLYIVLLLAAWFGIAIGIWRAKTRKEALAHIEYVMEYFYICLHVHEMGVNHVNVHPSLEISLYGSNTRLELVGYTKEHAGKERLVIIPSNMPKLNRLEFVFILGNLVDWYWNGVRISFEDLTNRNICLAKELRDQIGAIALEYLDSPEAAMVAIA